MNNQGIKRTKLQNLAVSVLATLLFGVILAKFCVINASTDERQLMMLLSNEVEASAFVVHFQSQFGYLIRFLYRLFPQLEIYFILVYGATLVTQFLLVYSVLDRVGNCKPKTRIAAFLFSFTLSCFAFTKFLLAAKYTHAAILLPIGAFLYVLIKKKITPAGIMLVSLLCAFGAGFRWIGTAMIFPFVLLAVAYKLISNRSDKKQKRMCVTAGVCVAVVVLGSYALNSALYLGSGSDTKDLLKVDKLRASLQDYKVLPSYEKYKEAYDEIGMSAERVKLIRHGLWGIADVTDIETLEKLVKIRDDYYSYLSLTDKLNDAWDTFKEAVCSVKIIYHFAFALLLITAFAVSIKSRDKLKLLLLIFTSLGVLLEVLYLCIRGRMPFRVFFPLELIPILVSGLIIGDNFINNAKLSNAKRLFAAAFVLIFSFGASQTIYLSQMGFASFQSRADLTEKIEQTDGKLYLHLGSMAASRVNFIHHNKNYSSYINAGGNISEMPYWKNLVWNGYSGAAEALAKRDDIRFVSEADNKDVQNITDYLNQEGYDVSCEFEEIEVDGETYRIWKINQN